MLRGGFNRSLSPGCYIYGRHELSQCFCFDWSRDRRFGVVIAAPAYSPWHNPDPFESSKRGAFGLSPGLGWADVLRGVDEWDTDGSSYVSWAQSRQQEIMRCPGIEPGTPAWQANALTPGPQLNGVLLWPRRPRLPTLSSLMLGHISMFSR